MASGSSGTEREEETDHAQTKIEPGQSPLPIPEQTESRQQEGYPADIDGLFTPNPMFPGVEDLTLECVQRRHDEIGGIGGGEPLLDTARNRMGHVWNREGQKEKGNSRSQGHHLEKKRPRTRTANGLEQRHTTQGQCQHDRHIPVA